MSTLPFVSVLRRGGRRVAAGLVIAAGAAVGAPAQVVAEGTLAFAAGGTLLDGDQPAFQKAYRQRKDGFAGIEEFSLTRLNDHHTFRFEARALPGNGDYRFALQWEQPGTFYLLSQFLKFRTYYDGSGGRLLPRDLAFSYFDENLAVDRSYFFLEMGNLQRDSLRWRLRYDRNTRDGAKNSIRWGDSNFAGAPFSPRGLIPSILFIDEIRDIFTAEIGRQTDESQWKMTGRYQRSRVRNTHVARRRALEPAADRYLTMVDGQSTDALSGHGSYERIVHENLRVSAGGLMTSIDTNLTGSRIYGAAPDAEFTPVQARNQSGDGGYFGLTGHTRLKQYLANANVYYRPTPRIAVIPAIKYEHLRQDSGEDHTETSVSGAGAAAATRLVEAASRDAWNEVTEDLEVRYLRWSNWQLSARGQWNQGTGNIVEQSILLPNRTGIIDRDADYRRVGQRYLAGATWYVRPGLTFGANYNYRLKLADYRARRDATANTNVPTQRDRYPHFLVDNDIASQDVTLRASWRPKPGLSLGTRYAHQRATVSSTFDNLGAIDHGQLRRHVISQTALWQATPRLYLNGAVNVAFDRLAVPAHRYTVNADNNHVNTTVGGGYALGKVTDVLVDLTHYRADNYTDNPEFTLPLNAGQMLQSAFVTWVRRHSARVTYTARYGFARNRDGTYGGQNDFSAHMFYGKAELKF